MAEPRITAEQVRAARALLRWEQKDLADKSGVSHPTVVRLERDPGPLKGYARTVAAIREAFEREGVVFLMKGDGGGEGVRRRG
ncbi:helix-turn-helix domain-containing protein [Salinarimonas sp.]|uniref:helix-turn-helix domain-containing protein n=1 Tax=Salinarimonas sp. TaxID=2766526 RepID=UPI00391D1E3F